MLSATVQTMMPRVAALTATAGVAAALLLTIAWAVAGVLKPTR